MNNNNSNEESVWKREESKTSNYCYYLDLCKYCSTCRTALHRSHMKPSFRLWDAFASTSNTIKAMKTNRVVNSFSTNQNGYAKSFMLRCAFVIAIVSFLGSRELFWPRLLSNEHSPLTISTKKSRLSLGKARRNEDHRIMNIAKAKAAAVFNSEHILTLQDFPDLMSDIGIRINDNYGLKSHQGENDVVEPVVAVTRESIPENDDRLRVWEVLDRAGLKIDQYVFQALPSWTQVTKLYGEKPVFVGLETCEEFRATIPPQHRFVGVAGQMNTGTNALGNILSSNLYMPGNNVAESNYGILWTVPWYKHGWLSLRYQYKYRDPQQHNYVFPVVVVRDPYFWMHSMCQSPYTLQWNMTKSHCPNLIEDISQLNNPRKSTHVSIRWGGKFIRTWASLAHMWSSWYREYYEARTPTEESLLQSTASSVADAGNNKIKHSHSSSRIQIERIPRLMIRFEDVLFHVEEVVEVIRQCVGAEWKSNSTGDQSQRTSSTSTDYLTTSDQRSTSSPFIYATAPAKTHPYFSSFKKHQSSLVSALIKYGQEGSNGRRRVSNMTNADIAFAKQYIDDKLLQVFHYSHPNVE